MQRQELLDHVPAPIRTLISRIADLLPYSAHGKNFLRMISRPTALERNFEDAAPHYLLQRLLTPEWMPPADAAFHIRKTVHSLWPGFVLPGRLAKVDRMSMANSLEVRCPMLDEELAKLAARISRSWRLKNGRGKDILIRAVGHRLPQELLRQPKPGTGAPLGRWFRGSLRNFVWDHLTSQSFLDRRMVSPEFVMHLLEEHDSGRRDNYRHLWKLLMLELWFQEDGRLQAVASPAEARTA
jgi:asparagine synthase (glutamine-hydrolysing)